MADAEVQSSREECRERVKSILEAVFRAGEKAGLNRACMNQADNIQGCSLRAFANKVFNGDVVIHFFFGHPPKLLKNVEFQVSAYADNSRRLPYLYQSVEIGSKSFPHNHISEEWLVARIKEAIYKLKSMCTTDNFARLKEEHNKRNGILYK